eukprot:TRINITY_DN375_c1_g1_i5.p2 TRINITY_DN375_c1_g1~~TRINITY_DN375_c1_g1_i5.p2  ORF type:complete len:175 (+),score=28.10 TRINITY_DN375_c1_g1_i5:1222-1746(+)
MDGNSSSIINGSLNINGSIFSLSQYGAINTSLVINGNLVVGTSSEFQINVNDTQSSSTDDPIIKISGCTDLLGKIVVNIPIANETSSKKINIIEAACSIDLSKVTLVSGGSSSSNSNCENKPQILQRSAASFLLFIQKSCTATSASSTIINNNNNSCISFFLLTLLYFMFNKYW